VSLSSFVCRRIAQEIHKLLSLIADKGEVCEVNGDFGVRVCVCVCECGRGCGARKCVSVGSKHLDCRWEYSLNSRLFPYALGMLNCWEEKSLRHVAYE